MSPGAEVLVAGPQKLHRQLAAHPVILLRSVLEAREVGAAHRDVHEAVDSMRSLRAYEVEELLEVSRKSHERQRSHAARFYHEFSAGNVDEEVDVAAVPASEVVVLDEVKHLGRRDAKGQKSNACLKYASSLGRSSLQEKLKSEARQPHRSTWAEAEVQHVLRERLKCLCQAKWLPGAAAQQHQK